MKCDELKEVMNVMQVSGEHIPSGYYKKSDVDAAIEELKAANKLLKEHIANGDVSRITWIDDCIDKDKEIAELKKKLMPCLNGDCILTCEVVEKYGKENAELKAKLAEKESLVKMLGEGESAMSLELEKTKQKLENVQASMYADVVDANMENRKLRRELWIARAKRAIEKIAWFKLWNSSISTMNPEDGARQEFYKWKKSLGKFLKKAEEFK